VINKLYGVIAMSTWGEVPDDFSYRFNPIRDASNAERSELAEQTTRSLLGAFNTGVIGRKTTLKELREQSGVTGMFTNITDAMIEEAEDEVALGMEEGGQSAAQAWELPEPLSRQSQYQAELRKQREGGGKKEPAA
jgi:hypothetical protein